MTSSHKNRLSPHARDFINDAILESLLRGAPKDKAFLRDVLAKSLAKEPLNVPETAVLLAAQDDETRHEIFESARTLKNNVYGNRIVLFAPLYIGNECVNNCLYCGFRRSNDKAERHTLDETQVRRQVEILEDHGHKRLILVFGEYPLYDAEFMARTVRAVYDTRKGHGEIRRVNINAAPLDVDGFRTVKEAGIGTYQIFQETYHHATYAKVHPANTLKGDYLWRLDGVSRAMEAGCDDVGIGALYGLHDWKYETLGLVSHAIYLRQRHGVGPHTISFPRVRPASGVNMGPEFDRWKVADEDFKLVIAVLRLAVPYTGLILTARENPEMRREAMSFGVSQIDAGSRIELGGYGQAGDAQCMEREQFELGDIRSLDAVMGDLLTDGYIPSFCTACYRLGRTGEHFMEFAIPGFIKRFCTPNALTTLMEYLTDYSSDETRKAGMKLIDEELAKFEPGQMKETLIKRLEEIRTTEKRDLYF